MSEHGPADLPFRLGEDPTVAFRSSTITQSQMLFLWEVIWGEVAMEFFPQQIFLMLRR